MIVVCGGVRDDAIRRCEDLQIAHIGIIGGEEDADVAGDARQDHAPDTKRVQQSIERGIEEAECLGFSTK